MKQKNLLSFLGIIACLLLSMPVVGGNAWEEAWKDRAEVLDAKTLKFHLTVRSANDLTVSIDVNRTILSGEIFYTGLFTSYIYYKEWTGSSWGPEVPILYYGSFNRACMHDGVNPLVCVEASEMRLDQGKKGVMAITKPADSSSVVGTFEVTNSLLSKYYDTVEWGWNGREKTDSKANGFTQHCLDYDTRNSSDAYNTNFYMDVAWKLPGSLSEKKIMVGIHRVRYDNKARQDGIVESLDGYFIDLLPHFFYDYVDLGLPSGTLWANHNIGAASPEEFGNYYAWGEVEPKDSYTAENYKWGTQLNHYTKYQNDGRLMLEMLDNAASKNWGASWNMPTKAQFEELSNSCNITWTQLNGVDGYRFTSKTDNSKSIFIPAAGQKWMDNSHSVCLFSKEIDNIEEGSVWRFKAENGEPFTIASTVYRPIGLPVRPVKTSNQTAQDLLWITGTAMKTEYYVLGESFDVSGLEVYFLPKEGSAEKVTKGVDWIINPATFKKGDKSVTVTASYDGVTSDPMEIPITFKELKPAFSPEGCSFVDKMEVEMTSDVEGVKIYFTLDGSTPTTKSTVYVKPITINTSVTVKAIAVFGDITSEVASASYVKISDYVDLGLPSGNLWASCNMGATKPEDRGTVFCWGEIIYTGSNSYSNYKWRIEGGDEDSDYSKYNKEDGKTVLESQDDVAYMNLGPRWCMPTSEDYQELIDNCSSVYTSVGGIEGRLFTSNVNGNGLFFPSRVCWTSTLYNSIEHAKYFGPYSKAAYVEYGPRYYAANVRAIIRPENINANEGVYISGTPNKTSYLAGSIFDVDGLEVFYRRTKQPEGTVSTRITEGITWTFDPAVIPVGCKFVTVTASYKGLTSTPIKVAITTDDFAPVFTPAAGSYEGIKAVTISCTDKNAKIYYTLNGSTPTTSSAQYTEPIIVGDAATIKAFVVNGDKQSNVMSASYTITQPDYVDLGLSSGLRWASKNVGAAKIEDYGKYYAWGETQNKQYYSWSTYIYGYDRYHLIKYQNDGKTVLEPQDDAAYINYGPRWHMPTNANFQELFDECDYVRIVYNNVPGVLFTSKTNGNSIFLPAAGNINESLNEALYYWASTVYDHSRGTIYRLKWIKNESPSIGKSDFPYYGGSVRPVMDANKMSVTDGIYIKGQTHTTSCYAGDAFDLSKLNVYYIKEGGISENVTGSATLTASPSVIPVGCTSVTVTASYKGMQATSVKVTIATKVREIDLGLTKRWAEFNLGTCIPTEYGNYYTWSDSLKNNKVAATLGSGWELPTREDVRELQDTTKCVWKWFEPGNTAYGGVAGYRVTGKRTGNSIFLPAAGTMSNSYFVGGGQVGNYWTSETGPQPLLDSYYMCFDRYDQCTGVDSQTNGKSVRAVKK